MGTLLVLFGLPLFFSPIGITTKECYLIENDNVLINASTENKDVLECRLEGQSTITAYYSVFSVLWGIGWAAIKISHLSLIPVLATSENTRMSLNSINYAVDVMSIICFYGAAWIFLRLGMFNRCF